MVGRLREVDVPCAKVMTRDEVLAQEQLSANGTVDIYTIRLRLVAAYSRAPVICGERLEPNGAPTHGQHTREVLKSLA